MSRTWMYLIVGAIVVMALVGGYQVYNSLTGGNISFNKTVPPMQDNLNESILNTFYNSRTRLLVQTDNLDKK